MSKTKFHIKCIVILLLATMPFYEAFTQVKEPALLAQLKKRIAESAIYDAAKNTEINRLRNSYPESKKKHLYNYYLKLFDAYSTFNYDSSYSYVKQLKAVALSSGDSSKISYAAIKFNFILLSAGMFKEVFDSLETVNLSSLREEQKAEYYLLKARCYFDVSDYNHDNYFSPRYNIEANKCLDSALILLSPNSFDYQYYNGLKFIRAGNDARAAGYLEKLVKDTTLTPHEKALTTSTFADIFFRKQEPAKIIALLVQAAIADIESSTKETSAIFNLANLLFKNGDVKNATIFIQKAAADARFYGARQRMMQVSSVLPLITGKNLANVENEKKNIYLYAVILTALFIVLLSLILIIVRQLKKLKFQKTEITKNNNALQNLLVEKDLLLEEKEWLKKEIHHRVKNNLHTVLSLLESQSAFLKKEALVANLDSQHRVFSMSLIHQKLYQSENITRLDMSVYIPELINYLRDSFDTRQTIKFNLQIDPVTLNVTESVSVGIILTEAITNSIKHAFPDAAHGLIGISMKRLPNGDIRLSITDNGIGFPDTIHLSPTKSLGMRLMMGLTEDIHGVFSMTGVKGTAINIQFKTDHH